MRRACCAWALVILFGITLSAYGETTNTRDVVVKLFVTSNAMDFHQPWQSQGSRPNTGSGCIIDGNRILTNAHVVSNQTFIQVKKHADPKRYIARLLAIGHHCDLALLTVDDETFFDGIEPVAFGALPQLQDTVSVLGYPTGGDKLSITEGVVSRIEVKQYAHSRWNLLAVQIDAAVNPGNSGGPVMQSGKLVGIAMQAATNAQNIGYIIPTTVIQHFFDDLADGRYDGFPMLGIDFTGTENKTLREYYSIADTPGGVLAQHIFPFSSADGILRAGDVILALDDVAIDEDATFAFRDTERLLMSHLIARKQVGDTIKVRIIRDGAEQTLSMPLLPYTGVVPEPYFYAKPSYYICGGLVFSTLSMDLLLNTWGKKWPYAAPELTYYVFGKGSFNEERKKEVVVLLSVLPDEINIGYHPHRDTVIDKVNGRSIQSFEDLVRTLNTLDGKYVIIETMGKAQIILERAGIQDATRNIMQRYGIPAQYSEDVARWLQ